MSLITFEGVDGCGKSTQLKAAAAWLRDRGLDVVETFEPGATALGAGIRRLLLDGGRAPTPRAELFLFLADRAQHVQEIIRPALEREAIVLCDRYTDSTRAYQLAARGLSGPELEQTLSVAECGVHPDLTLWLDLPVGQALARMHQRRTSGGASTRMDREKSAFHEEVGRGFERIWRCDPERVQRIDARGNVEQVQARVRAVVAAFLGLA